MIYSYFMCANLRKKKNSWIGDPARVVMAKAVVEEILSKDLCNQTVSSSRKENYFFFLLLSIKKLTRFFFFRLALVRHSTRRWSASLKSTHSWLRTFVARTEGEWQRAAAQ